MATIDYKEKYEKAVQAAMLAKHDTKSAVTIRILEEIFPELKESEDEMIGKAIINVFATHKHYEMFFGVSVEDILAWLEKQGEHSNFLNNIQIGDKVTRNRDGVLVNLSQLNRVAKKDEKQGEQKPADKVEPRQEELTKFEKAVKQVMEEAIECGDTHNLKADADMLLSLVQKSAWSEEDESRITTICTYLQDYARLSGSKSRTIRINEYCDWLKFLKERVQPKMEWSEEDEDAIAEAIIALEDMYDPDEPERRYAGYTLTFDKAAERLKDLRPQNKWKPSDEQMEALWNVYRGGKEQAELATLYNDLKKLRNE